MAERADESEHPPSDWIARFAAKVGGGAVLDVAAGGGRHSLLFRRLGHAVVAVDRDPAGLPADDPGLTVVTADLEDGHTHPVFSAAYAAVVVANYLHRPLLPAIIAAVAPGGLLLYETFAEGNEKYGHPRNPDFLLRRGELLEAVAGQLSVLAYEHGEFAAHRTRAVIQRIAARRDGSGRTGERAVVGE